MAAFFQYARNITYYLVFITFVGLLAPNGQYKKYISLVTGILLIGMVLKPIQSVINAQEIPITALFAQIVPVPSPGTAGSIGAASAAGMGGTYGVPGVTGINDGNGLSAAEEYEQWRYETIKAAFDEQLQIQLASILSQNNYELLTAEIEAADDFSKITRITAVVTETAAVPTPKPFIRIEPVKVRIAPDAEDDNASETEAAIKKLLSDFYNMSIDNIHVIVRKTEGG